MHTHTLKVAIFDPTAGPDGYSFEREKEYLGQRLRHVAPFRWRLLPTPLNLYHPLWIEDRPVDLDFHIRRVSAASPGGARELADIIGEIASRPLDRDHPLWESWLIEGLEGGKVAAVSKMHHALADGPASVVLLEQFLTPGRNESGLSSAVLDRAPSKPALVRLALAELLPQLGRALVRLPRYGWGLVRSKLAQRKPPGEQAAQPFSAPRTSLNRVISAQRRFAFSTVSLADAKMLRATFGVTINDVVLATVSGALNRYLESQGELPDRPLVAAVPVSLRPESVQTSYGNASSVWYVNLPTDIADPAEKLLAIHHGTTLAKREYDEAAGAHFSDLLELLPSFLLRGLFVHAVTQMQRRGRPPHANVIVSNVRGPQQRLSYSARPLDTFYSVGPLLEGIGLNITAWSYVDQLNFSLLADRNVVSDLWDIANGLPRAFAELVEAAKALGRQQLSA